MHLSFWVIIIVALIFYAVGYHIIGQNDAKKKAQEQIDRLFTKIVNIEDSALPPKKMVKKKQDINSLSEVDADYFAELTTE